jgi:hypothetical protein
VAGSTFTNLPSWSDSFNTKLPSSLNTPTGGGGNMLPLALGLGSSVISGLFGMGQAKTSASIAQAQLAAQNAAMLEGREQNKGQLAGALFNKLFDVGSGGDISFQREKDAKMFEVGPYAERIEGARKQAAKEHVSQQYRLNQKNVRDLKIGLLLIVKLPQDAPRQMLCLVQFLFF